MELNSRQERIQVLYEISLAIGRGEDLEETARDALSGYLRKLNCAAGAVLEHTPNPDGSDYEEVAATPARPQRNEGYRAALAALSEADGSVSFRESLPAEVESGSDTGYIMDLSGFGVLILVTSGDTLDASTLAALDSLNEKLADACRAERTEQRLRVEQGRFETVFQTIPEPMARVREQGGEPVVMAVNAAFAETFGCEPTTASGAHLSELVEPAPASPHETIQNDWLTGQTAVEREVEYRTADGTCQFMFRSAPTAAGGHTEQFCLFIDIGAQRRRQEVLEALVRTADGLLDSSDTTAVCDSAVEVAASVLGFDRCGVFLYDRGQEALVAAATTADRGFNRSTSFGPESLIWEVYQSGEPRRVPDTSAAAPELAGDSALALPLGTHGLFVTCTDGVDGFEQSDEDYGRLLATLVRSALDRVGREQSLREIHETTSALVAAESTETVATMLVERAVETFGLPISSVWRHDEAENVLRPIANSELARELFGEIPTFGPDNSITWDVFTSGEPEVVADIDEYPQAYNQNSVLESEVIVPVGDFGVVAAGSRFEQDFSQAESELLQTLTSGAESAFELVEQREEADILDQIVERILRHNIRNDISAIRGWAQLIAENGGEYSTEKARAIVSKSDQLLSTTQNAREIREVVDKRGRRIEFDIPGCVASAVSEVKQAYAGADIETERVLHGTVEAHPELDEAICHAIENGVEHGGNGTVSVSTGMVGDQFLLEIADDGPGIPEHELEPLQNREETDLTHGSGAGLWIIDRVLEYSGGTATFDGANGTTVQFRFPMKQVDIDTPRAGGDSR